MQRSIQLLTQMQTNMDNFYMQEQICEQGAKDKIKEVCSCFEEQKRLKSVVRQIKRKT